MYNEGAKDVALSVVGGINGEFNFCWINFPDPLFHELFLELNF